MSEAIFPVFGPVMIFACVLPFSALLAKLAIVLVGGGSTRAPRRMHDELRYFLVVMASAAPLVWLVSASLHQTEPGRSTTVCAFDHAFANAFCPETPCFALALLVCCVGFGWLQAARSPLKLTGQRSWRSERARARLSAIARARPELGKLLRRCVIEDALSIPIATIGVLRPHVVVRTEFIEQLDDEALVGALHHEREHVRGFDPLRYSIAGWALTANPWGRFLLERELSQWMLARELYCDRAAVLAGASAAAVAQAIVTAARPTPLQPRAALGDIDSESLKLRVQLLLAYTERPPVRSVRQPAFIATCAAMIGVALLPHAGATGALDCLHRVAESAVMYVAH